MLTHCVFFWLKDGITSQETGIFEKGLASLTTISGVLHGTFGVPASTDRPVIDRSYSYGLMVKFNDLTGHDAYQVDPVHEEFLESCSHLWVRVQVYDFVEPSPR
jgi:hypothetical protein